MEQSPSVIIAALRAEVAALKAVVARAGACPRCVAGETGASKGMLSDCSDVSAEAGAAGAEAGVCGNGAGVSVVSEGGVAPDGAGAVEKKTCHGKSDGKADVKGRRKGVRKRAKGPAKKVPGQSRYWTPDEHRLFLEALNMFGHKDLKAISAWVGTRNMTQVRYVLSFSTGLLYL